jgi:DNA polymerase I-like protein with 3'-5' exonuclease and polymerase domains
MVWGRIPWQLRLGCSISEARKYISLHRKNYAQYWEFVEATQATASLTCSSISQLGWIRRYQGNFNPRSAQNFPIQAAGADCLIQATVSLFDAGFEILATVHDAVLVSLETPGQAAEIKHIMAEPIKPITGGHSVRVDVELFSDHYIDEDGVKTLQEVLKRIDAGDLVPGAWL